MNFDTMEFWDYVYLSHGVVGLNVLKKTRMLILDPTTINTIPAGLLVYVL